MFRKLIASACIATLCSLAQAGEASGTLVRDPDLGNFDVHYLTGLNQSHSYGTFMAGVPMQLQARLTWQGPHGVPIATGQHAVVAFTQIGAKNTAKNVQELNFFSHGIGAFVGETGLAMELWFRHTNAQPNINLATQDAFVWYQTHGRCAQSVAGSIPQPGPNGENGIMCLSPTPAPGGYITPSAFQLRYGYHYWVRTTISANASTGYGTLVAELYEDTATPGSTPVLKQTGSFGFPLSGQNSPFPLQGAEPIYSTVARTPGAATEPVVTYYAFDHL